MISRRFFLKILGISFFAEAKMEEDIDVLGCKLKKDRLYRINEERMLFQWVREEGKDLYSVGFMPILSALVYPLYSVKIKPVGAEVEYDGNIAVVEAGKRVSTFPSPLSGKIVDKNSELEKDPSSIIGDPYRAWLVKIESKDKESLRKLKRAEEIVDTVRKIIIREQIECPPRR
jgi:Glycine cleavage system H protein (lipoate-binding)